MDGVMVKDTVVADRVAGAGRGAVADRGGAADWTMAGGMVASESGAAYGEEEPRVNDSGRAGVPAPMKPSLSRRTQGPLSPGGDAVGAA